MTTFKPTDQREKVLMGEHIDFSVEKCVVDKTHPNRSKSWQQVGVFSFETSILSKYYIRAVKMCGWCIKTVVK